MNGGWSQKLLDPPHDWVFLVTSAMLELTKRGTLIAKVSVTQERPTGLGALCQTLGHHEKNVVTCIPITEEVTRA